MGPHRKSLIARSALSQRNAVPGYDTGAEGSRLPPSDGLQSKMGRDRFRAPGRRYGVLGTAQVTAMHARF